MFPANILLLSSDETETRRWIDILQEHVVLTKVRDRAELRNALEGGDFDALLCAWSYYERTWNDVLKTVQEIRPDLPVILFSRVGGEREWVQAIEAGAFDLLSAPYYWKSTVLPVLEQAVDSCEARRRLHSVSQPLAQVV